MVRKTKTNENTLNRKMSVENLDSSVAHSAVRMVLLRPGGALVKDEQNPGLSALALPACFTFFEHAESSHLIDINVHARPLILCW